MANKIKDFPSLIKDKVKEGLEKLAKFLQDEEGKKGKDGKKDPLSTLTDEQRKALEDAGITGGSKMMGLQQLGPKMMGTGEATSGFAGDLWRPKNDGR